MSQSNFLSTKRSLMYQSNFLSTERSLMYQSNFVSTERSLMSQSNFLSTERSLMYQSNFLSTERSLTYQKNLLSTERSPTVSIQPSQNNMMTLSIIIWNHILSLYLLTTQITRTSLSHYTNGQKTQIPIKRQLRSIPHVHELSEQKVPHSAHHQHCTVGHPSSDYSKLN